MPGGDLVLADDLTGALEAGALFATAGVSAAVHIARRLPAEDSTPATVLDLETRHASEAEVRSIYAEATRDARGRRVYLKIDSTMRGPIGSAIEGVLDAWPECKIVLAPAYPAMGRTVRGGVIYVNGQPVSQTAFSRDPLNPSVTSHLLDSIPQSLRSEGRIVLCDSEDQQQLSALATTVADSGGDCVCVGSSGLLAELIRRYHGIRAKSGLIVVGSLHEVSKEQCSAASAAFPRFELAGDHSITTHIVASLKHHEWVILSTGPRRDDRSRISEGLAEIAASVVAATAIDSLVVFGGDTTAEILSRLGVQTIHPIRELLPGIPVSRIVAADRNLLLVTKAGGFGDRDIISRITSLLTAKE